MAKSFRRICAALTMAALLAVPLTGFADLDLPTARINGVECYVYTVKPKQTIFGLTKELNLTRAQIVKYNPQVADGLLAGQVLYFPKTVLDGGVSDTSADRITEAPGNSSVADRTRVTSRTATHHVARGETIYGISRRYGITEDELIAANPALSRGLKARQTLVIPVNDDGSEMAEQQPASRPQYEPQSDVTADEPDPTEQIPDSVSDTPRVYIGSDWTQIPDSQQQQQQPEELRQEQDTIRIGVMLPFMLADEHPDKQAQLYTEFYKGFLVAVDSLRNDTRPLQIKVYDTAANMDSLNYILSKPEVASLDVIVAPDDDGHLARIAEFGNENGIYVLNIFAVKSSLYHTNPYVLQANIPHSSMYEYAVDRMLEQYEDFVPVLIHSADGKSDKAEFLSLIRSKCAAAGRQVIDIDYHGSLRDDDLTTLPIGGRYVFVPASGTKSEFHRVIEPIKRYKEGLDDYTQVQLFGYPEWITFQSDLLDDMHFMNATIYSRFFNDENSSRSRDFVSAYEGWYGNHLMKAIPVQGMLGFDTGFFLVKALNSDNFPCGVMPYNGIQSDYRFVRVNENEGPVNNTLFFINFRPSGIIDRNSL